MTDEHEATPDQAGPTETTESVLQVERERFTWRTGAVVALVAAIVLSGMTWLSLTSEENAPKPQRPAGPGTVAELRFAVWGNAEEIAAYQAVVDDYNASSKGTEVQLDSFPSPETLLVALRAGSIDPDLYLLPRSDLAEIVAQKRNQPLLDLINAREIPIGDDFARDAVSAFSTDDDLQCLPYITSPMVMYYNKALVDFTAMAAQGLPVPPADRSQWTFAQFRAAAEFASRPEQRTVGVHIEPTIAGLEPFVYSGGGKVFDDDTDPTSLALGDDGSTDALRQTLEVLRDPRLTLSARQLERRPALDWFKRGRVAMIAGYRDLVPELRATEGLDFDVMPMPSLGSDRTVGEMDGVCLARAGAARTNSAANFLSYLVSDEALARVAATGYLQPAKLTVTFSDAFLQPGLAPENAKVFNDAVRDIVVPPLLDKGPQLQALVGPDIAGLFSVPVLDDLAGTLKAIDEKSRSLLDPDYEPSEAPSPSGTPSPSGSPSPPVAPAPSGSATDTLERD